MLWYLPEQSGHVFSVRVLTNEQAAALRSLVGHLTFRLCQFGREQKHAVGVKARSNTVEVSKIHKIHSAKIKKRLSKHQNHSNHFRGNTFTRAACEQQPEKYKRKKETETRHLVHKFCISEEPFFKKSWIEEEFAPGFEKQSFAVVLQKNKEVSFWKKKKKQEARSFFSYCILLHEEHLKQFSAPGRVVVLTFASSFSFPPL